MPGYLTQNIISRPRVIFAMIVFSLDKYSSRSVTLSISVIRLLAFITSVGAPRGSLVIHNARSLDREKRRVEFYKTALGGEGVRDHDYVCMQFVCRALWCVYVSGLSHGAPHRGLFLLYSVCGCPVRPTVCDPR